MCKVCWITDKLTKFTPEICTCGLQLEILLCYDVRLRILLAPTLLSQFTQNRGGAWDRELKS